MGGHNAITMAALGNKSPNLQSPPNVAVSKDQMAGLHQSLLSNTSHPNQHHSPMPMSSMQGNYGKNIFIYFFILVFQVNSIICLYIKKILFFLHFYLFLLQE